MIRRYRIEDELATVGVWHRAGLAQYTYLPTWQAFTLTQAERVFREVIAPECDLWVAEQQAVVVAYMALKHSYIDRLYVDPDHQRRGWGSRLLALAKELHAGGLELHTHRANRQARDFYERHDFKVVRYGVSPAPESALDVEYRWRPAGDRQVHD